MIIHSFDRKKEALINPENLVKRIPDFPEFFISSFSNLFTKKIIKEQEAKEIGRIYLNIAIPIFSFEYEGKTIGYFESPMGAPAAVMAEEELFAMGAEEILYFGSCGYLDSETEVKSFFIPYEAYRDEGTSYHYYKNCDYIRIEDNYRLCSVFDALRIPYESIRTWTTDGFFRETRKNRNRRLLCNCKTVEMECAAVMACAQFRGKHAYQFLYSTDFLDEDYDPELLKRLPGTFAEYILEISMKAALLLMDEKK